MQARRRAQPSGTNSPSSSHPRLKAPSAMRDLHPCPPCGRQGRPGQGFLAGSNTSEPRGSAPRERDHRGGDHPVPSRTRQLSPPSPRVLQRKAAGGQGVALAEGAFLYAPREARRGIAPAGLLRVGEVAASLAARSALRCIRPPPGIVGRAGTAGGLSLAGLSASWGIVRWGGLIGAARRRLFIFMRPRRGSRAWAEGPQGDRPLWVFLYSEAVRCRRICARTSCWTGPVHGMCWRICVGSLRAF